MTTYKEIKITNKAHAAYIADAVAALYNDMEWLTNDEMDQILVFKRNANADSSIHTDWVAIPAIYCDETTEFTTLRGASVRLDSSKWGEYVVTETEW
jgi:hypothetical protein